MIKFVLLEVIMKKLGTLLALLFIFVVQGSSLCAMKRSKKEDISPVVNKMRKDEKPFTYPNIQDLGCYQMLLSLLENPSHESFNVTACCCIQGCKSLIQTISAKIKDSEDKSKLIEIREALLGKLLELKEKLNPTGIDEVISQLEHFSINS